MQIGKVNNLAFGNAAKAGAAKSASTPKNQGAKKDTVTILGKEVNKKAAIGAGVGAAVVTTLAALAGRGNKLHKLQGEEGHYFKKFFSNVADGAKSFFKKNADGVNEYKALKEAAKNNKAAEAAKEVTDEVTEQTLKADNTEVKQPGDQPTEVKPEGQPAEQKPEVGGSASKPSNVKLEVSDAYSDDEHINIVKEFHKLGAGE